MSLPVLLVVTSRLPGRLVSKRHFITTIVFFHGHPHLQRFTYANCSSAIQCLDIRYALFYAVHAYRLRDVHGLWSNTNNLSSLPKYLWSWIPLCLPLTSFRPHPLPAHPGVKFSHFSLHHHCYLNALHGCY